ncbi:MAG: hypothetical protein IJ493_02750 [Clostridia bacterium]|nr:hypothetical protein [Clostridia bacterium]
MPTCTFIGHRNAPSEIYKELCCAIEQKIHEGYITFYVGNQGSFDALVIQALNKLKQIHPHITPIEVLAYFPEHSRFIQAEHPLDTLYPENMETVPRRFAIPHRNLWMLKNSQALICYINHSTSNAYKFYDKAKKAGLAISNLGSFTDTN